MTGTDGLSRDDAFSYDRNGNRVTKVEGATSVSYTYDRTDQLVSQTIGAQTTAFAYNAYGDLTSGADIDGGTTAHAYDAGGRLVSLTPPGAAASSFTHDALGRVATRSTGSASLTYRYVGSGHVSYATLPGSGAATYALVDATHSRLALDTGGVTAWTVFDLHANLAATGAEASSALVGAVRYDAYGQTLDAWSAASGATEMPWRFQGRLDLSSDPDEPLYDYGARLYRPSAGTFTQLDTYAGRAVDPLSLNRFLYAHANPTTLVDPDGHAVYFKDGAGAVSDTASAATKQGHNLSVSASLGIPAAAISRVYATMAPHRAGMIDLRRQTPSRRALAVAAIRSVKAHAFPDLPHQMSDGEIRLILRTMDTIRAVFPDAEQQQRTASLGQNLVWAANWEADRRWGTDLERADFAWYGLALAVGLDDAAGKRQITTYDADAAMGTLVAGGNAKASELVEFAESNGWVRTQSGTGPIKFVDEAGVERLTIKMGSARTPGSNHPHIEMRNASNQRIDAWGNEVTRKSPGNHTPIIWDLP